MINRLWLFGLVLCIPLLELLSERSASARSSRSRLSLRLDLHAFYQSVANKIDMPRGA